jgi:hypothetical protein
MQAIRQFDESIDLIHKHFNLFYCEGCIMGPGTSAGGKNSRGIPWSPNMPTSDSGISILAAGRKT